MRIIENYKIRISYGICAITAFYCFDFYLLLFRQIMPVEWAKAISLVILYSLFLVAILKSPKRLKLDAIILLIINALLFFISYLMHPEYGDVMFRLPTWNIFDAVFTFNSGMFAYLFFRMEDSPKQLRKCMDYSAYILFFWCLMRIVSAINSGGFNKINANGVTWKSTYDMSVGYRLLFVSIVFYLKSMDAKKLKCIFYRLLAVIASILMVIYGSRSAVASFILFWILYTLFGDKENKSVNVIIKKIVILLVVLVSYYVLTNKVVLTSINDLFNSFGVNSRMLNSLIEGSFELDKGRNRMWTSVINLIKEHPILGSGIYADRHISGIYCHQIILEILLNFGIIFGGIFLIILIMNILKMVIFCKDREWRVIFITFLSLALIRLNISSSFWYDTNFWVCIAIVVNYKRYKRLNKNRIYKGVYYEK